MSDEKREVITNDDVRDYLKKEYKKLDDVQKKLFREGWKGELDDQLGFEDIKKQPGYMAGQQARKMTQKEYKDELQEKKE